ncbi:extracellular solute-binding protein [Marmoricola sp. RAF53]|uniref:extracellular solute-binding protein n=1 Tax=Marmoricola sp. RAF53 TaxID=3233059 RepID=UPI003F99EEA3
MTRKRIVAVVLSVSALGLTACGNGDDGGSSSSSAVDGAKLVFVNYGGTSLDGAKKAWLDPFSKETGAKFTTDGPSDPVKVKAMVDAGRTTWDLIDLDAATGGAGCGTLFEKRGADVDISAVDPKFVTDDCGVPIFNAPIALVYNKKRFGDNPPTKLADFLDLEKFPGQRAIFNYAIGGYEPLLAADGVPADKIYPIDYARAGRIIDRLGNKLTLQGTLAQQNQLLESADFAMCLCYLGRAALAEKAGADIDMIWDTPYFVWDNLYAVKGSKFPKAQSEFLNFVATPEAQAAFTEEVPYSPTTPDSKPEVSKTFAKYLPGGHEAEMGTPVYYDAKWWAENSDEAFAKWTEITAG